MLEVQNRKPLRCCLSSYRREQCKNGVRLFGTAR